MTSGTSRNREQRWPCTTIYHFTSCFLPVSLACLAGNVFVFYGRKFRRKSLVLSTEMIICKKKQKTTHLLFFHKCTAFTSHVRTLIPMFPHTPVWILVGGRLVTRLIPIAHYTSKCSWVPSSHSCCFFIWLIEMRLLQPEWPLVYKYVSKWVSATCIIYHVSPPLWLQPHS